MQISLVNPVLSGAVAVIGAAAGATAPVRADVVLAAVDNPVQQLIYTAQQAQSYLFATYYNGGDAPTPGAGEANWPYAGMDQTGGDALNYALYNQIPLGYYNSVGLLPQITAGDAMFPALQQWATNVFDYSNVLLTGAAGAALALNNGVWSLPSETYDAVQLAFGGQLNEALTVLANAIVTPIADAFAAWRAATDYVVSRIAARAVAVAAEVSNFVVALAGSVGGGVQLLANQTAAILGEVVTQLGAGQFQNAWTAAVDGLFGPSGLPGTVLNLTIGAGVQTGPIIEPADIKTNFVPSIRTVLQAGAWTTQNALTTQPAPVASVPAAAAPAAAVQRSPRAAASRAVVRAPAAAAVKSGSVVKPDGARRGQLTGGH